MGLDYGIDVIADNEIVFAPSSEPFHAWKFNHVALYDAEEFDKLIADLVLTNIPIHKIRTLVMILPDLAENINAASLSSSLKIYYIPYPNYDEIYVDKYNNAC